MSNTPHTLADEFPGQTDAIHRLKLSDPSFARTLEAYDDVNDQIHMVETNLKPMDHKHEVELRKRRLQIKDVIAVALAESARK